MVQSVRAFLVRRTGLLSGRLSLALLLLIPAMQGLVLCCFQERVSSPVCKLLHTLLTFQMAAMLVAASVRIDSQKKAHCPAARSLAAAAIFWTCGNLAYYSLLIFGPVSVPSWADLFFLFFYAAMLRAFWLMPRKRKGSKGLLNELMDAATLVGVLFAVLWGVVDGEFLSYLRKASPMLSLFIGGFMILDFVMISLGFWSLLQRDEDRNPFIPSLCFLLACVSLVLVDIMCMDVMVTPSPLLSSLNRVAWSIPSVFLGLGAYFRLNTNHLAALFLERRFTAVPRQAVVLWTSQLWVAIVILMLLRDCLYPSEGQFPYLSAIVGVFVALFVALRQGRNLIALNQATRDLDGSNRCLEESNRRLNELNAMISNQAERRISEMTARVEELFEHVPWGIYFAKASGDFESMNPVMERMLGMSRHEVNPARLENLISKDAVDYIRSNLKRCIETATPVVFDGQLRLGGEDAYFSNLAVPIFGPEGKVLRVVAFVRNITAERKALIALQESEEKFSKIFGASPDGITVTELDTGKILETNRQFTRMFGYSAGELVGRKMTEIGVWESAEARQLVLSKFKVSGSLSDYEVRLRSRDGQLRDCLLSAEFIEIGGLACIISVFRDITDGKKAEIARRESEEKFEKAFKNSPDAIMVLEEKNGRIIDANDSLLSFMRETRRDQVIGLTVMELGLWADIAQRNQYFQELATKGFVRDLEVDGMTRDKTIRKFLLSSDRIELKGYPCLIAVVRDITEQKQMEAERREQAAREQSLRDEFTDRLILSQEAERCRIAGGLHDSIGQDLLLIKNRLQMACDGTLLSAAAKTELDEISSLAIHAITEVRRISHDLRPYQLDHLGLTLAMRSMIENIAKGSSCLFTHHLDDVDGLFTTDEATGLYRILQESLNNIMKHAQASNVKIQLDRDVHEVVLAIEDDGRGFDVATISSGLGLGNMGERARMLGGEMRLGSCPGHGTRLRIEIPIKGEL